jgi:uncharacterized protein (DUF433 family)
MDASKLDRKLEGYRLLLDATESDKDKCGGRLLIKGTRFPVSKLLAELAEDETVSGDFDLDQDLVAKILNGLALIFEYPPST